MCQVNQPLYRYWTWDRRLSFDVGGTLDIAVAVSYNHFNWCEVSAPQTLLTKSVVWN